MREIHDYEMQEMYGGFLTGLQLTVSIIVLAVGAYKMFKSESAKIKLPGGTDISFSGAKDEEESTKIKTSSRTKKSTPTKTHTLKQLDNIKQTFTSTPSNFLTKI